MATVRSDLDSVVDTSKTADEFRAAVVTLINTSLLSRGTYRATLRDIAAGLSPAESNAEPQSEVNTNA